MRPERRFKGRNGTGRASITALKTQIQGPAELNLLRAKNGLDIGGHFTQRPCRCGLPHTTLEIDRRNRLHDLEALASSSQ